MLDISELNIGYILLLLLRHFRLMFKNRDACYALKR